MPRKRIKLEPKRVERLPVAGSSYEFAKILNVDKSAVSLWISKESMPVVNLGSGRYSVIKDEFLAWAKKTGRV